MSYSSWNSSFFFLFSMNLFIWNISCDISIGTLSLRILFQFGALTLQVFYDADWVGDSFDPRSITDYIVFFRSTPIYRFAKKQPTVSHSSMEAEYQTLVNTTPNLYWFCQLWCNLYVFLYDPHVLWCDNMCHFSS